jgi:ATP-binding cassette subfamily B protein
MILDKALTLDLEHFEDSEFYDRLTRARREASQRPLSLVMRSFSLVQNIVSLVSYGVLLLGFSPWAVVLLIAAGLPGFVAEARFSNDAFRLFRWRSAERRMQLYLETVLPARTTPRKWLFGLGEAAAAVRTSTAAVRAGSGSCDPCDSWGFGLGLVATAALYGGYCWVAISAVQGNISIGLMTMYLLLFRQGQSAVSAALGAISGLYEDNLYLSTLYEYLDTEARPRTGTATQGPDPTDGLRLDDVSFTYPGSQAPALSHVNLHLKPGSSLALVGANGSGKTTLIKLITRLYVPTSGRILLDGLDLAQWDEAALRRRFGVIFQDYVRYQLQVGENIGAGDEPHFDDEARWREAAELGQADDGGRPAAAVPRSLASGSRAAVNCREGSGRRSQCRARSCAAMRISACSRTHGAWMPKPNRSVPACAEAAGRMVILISHRFSTVRGPADRRAGWRQGWSAASRPADGRMGLFAPVHPAGAGLP